MTATMENTGHTGPRNEYDAEILAANPQTVAAIGATVLVEALLPPQFDPFTAAPKTQRYESILQQIVD